MLDLFRYIEQSFVVPSTGTKAINVSDSSDFQSKLRNDIQLKKSNQEIRKESENFIEQNSSSNEAFTGIGQQYLDLHKRLLNLPSPTPYDVEGIIENIFDSSSVKLVTSDAFKKSKHFLNDLLVAVKMVTGFDKVPANDLVAMRQVIAFIETTAGRDEMQYMDDIKSTLLRPILVPAVFLKKQNIQQTTPFTPTPKADDEVQKREALKKEYDTWKAAYKTLISVRPDELQMREIPAAGRFATDTSITREIRSESPLSFVPAAHMQIMTLTDDAFRKLDRGVRSKLQDKFDDITKVDHSKLVYESKNNLHDIVSLLDPCDHIKPTTKVYRVGINAFAVKSDPVIAKPAPGAAPDFANVITRPVGIGNLQIVRQELMGYEANEVSHIENILQGETLRHSTIRKDISEVTTTEETQTIQFDERDLQSTVRNEMASETQKETGQQSSSAQDQTSTSNYGKLVENNKSNYAKTITDRAVSSLSQQVMHQRIQRERKSFTEKSFHEFDNSKVGAKNVTGIYQWVDKKYKTRIMNYGKRLLYDVVIPEPAAFLIESLKNAPQPEGLELTKPDVFDLCPSCLDEFNYACLAAKYGVSGAVTPPLDEFKFAKPYTDSSMDGPKQTEGFGNKDVDGFFYKAFTISIDANYKALKGYCQMVHPNKDGISGIEFFLGDTYNNILPFKGGYLITFPMNNETGDIPGTFRSWGEMYQYSFAMGVYCQRTDRALAEWQLKTHAAIMNGYNRQLADYQDKLSRFQALVRAQMANASNYAHNPSIERGELKKAFIYLLLSEHFNYAYKATPDPEIIPFDPIYIKNWGAMVAFFERAFEWENIMYTYYPYFWGRRARWGELILIQDLSPQFEEFLKAGAARIVVPVRPGFEGALAHYQETGDVWMGEEIPDMFSDLYVSIIQEIKARNFAPEDEVLVTEWDIKLPTTLVILKEDAILPDGVPV